MRDPTTGKTAALFQVLGQGAEDLVEHPFLVLTLEAAVAGLVGWIAIRQVAPGCSGAKDPQDTVEDVPRVAPRATFAVRPARGSGIRGSRISHCSLVRSTSVLRLR